MRGSDWSEASIVFDFMGNRKLFAFFQNLDPFIPGSEITYFATTFTDGRSILLGALLPSTNGLELHSEFFFVRDGIPEFLPGTFVPQAGTQERITRPDVRMKEGVQRDGRLYGTFAARPLRGDGLPKVHWFEINANGWPLSGSAPVVEQFGVIDPGIGIATFMPAMAVGPRDNQLPLTQNNIGFIYSRSSLNEPLSLRRAAHLAGSGLGQIAAGVDNTWAVSQSQLLEGITENRLGDYFAVEEDPSVSDRFWGHGQIMGPEGAGWITWFGYFDAQ